MDMPKYDEDELPEERGECSSCGETLEDCARLSEENDRREKERKRR